MTEAGKSLWLGKAQAVLIHLAISGLIFAVALYVILVYWYPEPYFGTEGGWQGIRLLAAVDLVLGPLLTLVIFNPAKSVREKVFDFSCIGAVQLSALLWGLNNIHSQHPVAASIYRGTVQPVPLSIYKALGRPVSDLDGYSALNPPLVWLQEPSTPEAQQASDDLYYQKGVPVFVQLPLFRPLEQHLDEFRAAGRDIDALLKVNPDMRPQLADLLAKHGGQARDYVYLPMDGYYSDALMMLTRAGVPVGALSYISENE